MAQMTRGLDRMEFVQLALQKSGPFAIMELQLKRVEVIVVSIAMAMILKDLRGSCLVLAYIVARPSMELVTCVIVTLRRSAAMASRTRLYYKTESIRKELDIKLIQIR